MPIPWIRRGAWVIGALLVLAIVAVVALPLLASTQIVRDRIAYQMSAWSGYRVRLDEAPEIRVWPTFQAVLNGVTLSDWDRENPNPVLETERMEIDLSALAALRGEVVFTEMELTRPVLRLTEKDGGLDLPAPHSWGRLARSVATAQTVVEASPNQPDTTALPNDKLGKIAFTHGRVVTGTGENQRDIVTSLTGTLDWPALNRSATFAAEGIWRGESVSLSASSEQPLLLFGGGNAPLEISVEAAPATTSFQGSASLSSEGFFDGQFSLSAPALGRLVEWTELGTVAANRIGPASVAAHLSGSTTRLKLEEATLEIGESTGTGLLDIGFNAGRPSLAGTLAFDTLDLKALVDAFNPLRSARSNLVPEGVDFDLRFSAETAGFGKVRLSNVAAATKANDGFTTFDVSDATVFGGRFQLSLRSERKSHETIVNARVQGDKIQAGQLADALGQQQLIPRAQSTFSVVLNGSGNDLESALATADGSVSVQLQAGSVPGLDLNSFLELSKAGDFFPVDAMAEGSLPIDGAVVKATLSNGVAEIDSAEAQSGNYGISLNGLVSLTSRGLALYGTLANSESTSPDGTPMTFFVGGSWATPFIASFNSTGTDIQNRE